MPLLLQQLRHQLLFTIFHDIKNHKYNFAPQPLGREGINLIYFHYFTG